MKKSNGNSTHSSNTRKLELLREQRQRERYARIDSYDPYPYQLKFHKTGSEANQRLLMAANRIGKSFCGSMELSYHLTGLYPDWWEGRVFKQPIIAWLVVYQTKRQGILFSLNYWVPPMTPKPLVPVLYRKT